MRRFIPALCLFLACTLVLSLCPGVSAAPDGSDIIFLALNDAMPYGLSSDTMPFWVGGTLYVHSTTFDITSLNLSASYNAGNMTLLLYSGATRRSLTFYLSDGYVQTQSGATEEITASMRGDQVFLPLDYCAGFFGIGVSYLNSKSGWPLVRLTTGAQVWEDVMFIEKADKLITERAYKYLGTSSPPPVTPPDPPDDNPPDDHPPGDDDDPPEDDPPDDDPIPGAPTVYPALVGLEAAQSALPLLTEHQLRAVFYLDAETILAHSDLVRQLYGAGHTIGLAGDAAAANDALDLVLCRRSLLTLDQPAEGYLCDFATHDDSALESLDDTAPVLLRLDSDDAGAALAQLLARESALLQLRETTTLFREPPAVEADAAEPVG